MTMNFAIVQAESPLLEPISVEEVKDYLRIDGESENDAINTMIIAARISAEKYMRASIIFQKWKLIFDVIDKEEIALPYGPVVSVESIKSFNEAGVETVFDAANYYLTAGNKSVFFKKIPSGQKIEIIYNTGFSETADGIPALVKQGMLTHIAYMFERKAIGAEMNSTAKTLYNFYRNMGV